MLSDEEVFVDEVDLKAIKKNLSSELEDDNPDMPPPPVQANCEYEKMLVFLRIRPLSLPEKAKGEDQTCFVVVDPTQINAIAPKESRTYEHSAHGCGKVINSFTFSKVFDESVDQRKLFESTMSNTCKDFLDGQSCLTFAYGVTNSGKTYTMQGNARDPGLIAQSLEMIFSSIADRLLVTSELYPTCYSEVKVLSPKEALLQEKFKNMVLNQASRLNSDSTELFSSQDSIASLSSDNDTINDYNEGDRLSVYESGSLGNSKVSVFVSFIEVYNEQIIDLLEPVTKSNLNKRSVLQLREDRKGNPYVKDMKYIQVTSVDEALRVLAFGKKNLQFAYTKLNESSSRSHMIFSIKLVKTADKANPKYASVNQLSFCDLAGSERCSKTQNTGERLKEAANINNTLLTLGRCIELLRQNQLSKVNKEKMVPYRDSKLTRLFQTFFCGQGKACMFVNIAPAASSFDETLQALKFGSIAKHVQIIPEKLDPAPKTFVKRTDVSIALAQEDCDNRMSIAWATAEELKKIDEESVNNSDSNQTKQCTELENYKIEKLKNALLLTDQELRRVKKDYRTLEAKLREEIYKEMAEHITEIEQIHEKELEEEKKRFEEAADRKINIVTSAINKSVKRKRQELEDEMKETTVSLSVYEAQKVKAERLEAQVELLQSKLDAFISESSLPKYAKYENKIDACTSPIKDSSLEVMLVSEIANHQTFIAMAEELSSCKTELVGRDQQIKDLEIELDKERSEVNQLKLELELTQEGQQAERKYQQQIKELEQEVLAVTKGLQSSDKCKEQVEHDLITSQSKLLELTSQLGEKDMQLDSLKSLNDNLNQQLLTSSAEYQNLSVEIESLKQTITQLTSEELGENKRLTKYDSIETSMKLLQDQLKRRSVELHGDMSVVQTQLYSAKKELERLRKEKERAEKNLTESQKELQQTISDSCHQKTALTEAEERNAELSARLQDLELQLSQLSEVRLAKEAVDTEVRNLGELLQKSERQESSLESTVYQLRKQINTTEEQLVASKDALADLQTQAASHLIDMKVKDTELERLNSLLVEISSKHDTAASQLVELSQRNQMLHEKLTSHTLTAEAERQLSEQKDREKRDLELKVIDLDKVKLELITAEQKCNELSKLVETLTAERNQLLRQQEEQINSILNKDVTHQDKEEEQAEKDVIILQLRDEIGLLLQMNKDSEKKLEQYYSFSNRMNEVNRKLDDQRQLHEQATKRILELTEENQLAQRQEGQLKEDNLGLQTDLASQLTKLKELENSLRSNSSAAITREVVLRDKISTLEHQLGVVQNQLKEVKEKERLIDELKAGLVEQAKTMEIQDKLLESKEEQLITQSQEYQDLLSKFTALKGEALSDRLAVVIKEKESLTEELSNSKIKINSLGVKVAELEEELRNWESGKTKKPIDSDSGRFFTDFAQQKNTDFIVPQTVKNKIKVETTFSDENERTSFPEENTQDILITLNKSSVAQAKDKGRGKSLEQLESRIVRKDKIILQLEQKIRDQEATIQNMAVSGRTSRTAARPNLEEALRVKNLEDELSKEQSRHADTKASLDRVLKLKDEQVADLKEANSKLQKELEKQSKVLQTVTPARPSDRFKDPEFSNDNELTGSTLELDMTPLSAKKKRTSSTYSVKKTDVRAKRKSSCSKKESQPLSSSKKIPALKQLKTVVENSTSALAIPAKKLLIVLSPLKNNENKDPAENQSALPDPAPDKPTRRRKLYTENMLTETPDMEAVSSTKRGVASNVHNIVTRKLQSYLNK